MVNNSDTKVSYQGNGQTTVFPFSFPFIKRDYIKVAIYDSLTEETKTLDRDYYVDTVANTVIYPGYEPGEEPAEALRPPILPATSTITIYRQTDVDQLTDLGEKYPLKDIENMADKLTEIIQEQSETLGRAVKVPIGDPKTPEEKLADLQNYVSAAADSAKNAATSEASAQRAAESAGTSAANAAESERLAGGYADTATAAASRAEDSAISARAYNAPDYDNATTYQAGEVVTYTDGNSYRALQETTGNEPPNIIYWQKVTDYVGDDFFEVDEYGYIVPMDSPSHSRYWRVDQNGYIVPIEGGDGGYRPDTRSLSAEYLNVTNEGYIKHLRADDVNAQDLSATGNVTAGMVTTPQANVTTLTANAVNAGTVTANDVKLNGGDLGAYLAESTGYGIVSGCEPSISGLTVTVGAGVVHLADGTRKEITSTNITLDAADGTNPRIDLVYIDSTGTVAKITGTAAASPSVPTLPSQGISVCTVSVAAGATTGTITGKIQNISSTMSLQDEIDDIKSIIRCESIESIFMAAARDDYTSPRLYRFYLSFNGRDFYNYASIPCPSDSAYDSSCLKYINGWFYITFTENTLISKDGINWKQINRALASVMDITWAWAPCLFCDDDGVIHVYSSLKDSNGHFTIIHYKVTQNLENGELSYVPNSLKYCNNIRENINVTDVIDPAMIKMNGAYIFGCKTEAPGIGMTVWNVSSPNLEEATLTRRFHKKWEGPEALQFVANENSILVYFQNYVQMSVYGECMFKLSVNKAGVVTGGPYNYSRINANGTGVRHMGVTKIPFAIARNIINNCNIYGYGMDPHYKIGSAVSFETTTDSYRRLPNYPEVTYVITRAGATGIYKIAPQAITPSDFVLYNFHNSDVTVQFPTNADADLPSWIQNYEITLPAYSKMVMPYINGVFYTPIVTKCTTIRQLT